MYIFINELSFEMQAQNCHLAHELMKELLEIIRQLKPIRYGDPLCSSNTLWSQTIAPQYTVQEWLMNTQKNHSIWFWELIRKGPYVETLLNQELPYHECHYQNTDVTLTSLAGAVFYEGVVTSLQQSPNFGQRCLALQYREGEDDFADRKIENLTHSSMVLPFLQRAQSILLEGISSWNDLWINRQVLFPQLVFCDGVRRQLNSLNFDQSANLIIRHLQAMNSYLQHIRTQNIVPDYKKMGIVASQETPITLHHYGHQRKFVCPDQQTRLFDWHSKQYGQNIRIHFYPPDEDNTEFLIGYIGRHLDTWTYH